MKIKGTGPLKTYNKLTELIYYSYLYCDSTYKILDNVDLKILIDSKNKFIKNAELQLNKFKPKNEPYLLIIKEQDKYPGVLKTRRCFAGLIRDFHKTKNSNGPQIIHIIWFDDGNISLENSLENILKDIIW